MNHEQNNRRAIIRLPPAVSPNMNCEAAIEKLASMKRDPNHCVKWILKLNLTTM